MSSNGSSGGVANLSLAEATTMAASQAVAWFAAMEVMLVTFTTFKKWRGLYFWSLNISALGILIKCVTNITRFFAIITPPIIPVAINEPAWVMMVTGQSLVLYSRLHLVIRDPRKLRWVLYMIIANGLILHVPTAVFTCGSNTSASAIYLPLYNIYEKVQVTGFFIQESIISFIYIYKTRKMVQDGLFLNKDGAKNIISHLIWINVVIVLADLIVVVVEFAGLLFMQSCLKSVVYAYKLRFEFYILNRFVELIQSKPTRDGFSNYGLSSPRSQTQKGNKTPSYSVFIRRTGAGDKSEVIGDAKEIRATTDIEVQSTDAIYPTEEHVNELNSNSFELDRMTPLAHSHEEQR